MSYDLNPANREETFLAKAAGQKVETPTPITRVEMFLKNLIDHISEIGAGGGTAVAQSDWNANEGEPGHILNRPFYSTYENIMLLDNTMVSYDDSQGGFVGFPNGVPVTGSTVTIIWNGTGYQCSVVDLSAQAPGMMAVGNVGAMLPDMYEITEDPFLFVFMSVGEQSMALCLPIDGTEDLSFTVRSVVERETQTIPEKYLPSKVYFIDITEDDFRSGVTSGIIDLDEVSFTEPVKVFFEGGAVFLRVTLQGKLCLIKVMVLEYEPDGYEGRGGTVSFNVEMSGSTLSVRMPNGSWGYPISYLT